MRTSSVPGFADLGVPQPLVDALAAGGITTPFPIQAMTLPDSLSGADILGRGRTGSGKTVAFALPLLDALAEAPPRRPKLPRALVLVPTRELANQVHETIRPLAAAVGANAMTLFGGVGQGPQVAALARGVDVVIATPGRLEDLLQQGHLRLSEVEVTVIDEADHMSDLGFLPAVRRILDKTPADGQRMLFSATLDGAVDVLVRRYLHEPVTHSVDDASSPVPTMAHHVLMVSAEDKAGVVRELVSGRGRTLAFTRTKHSAKKLAKQLTAAGIPAVDLHGNLSQGARERNLSAFSEGEITVMVATDIAARGIHVDEVALVVHVDPPAEHKAYLHRSGRTARAGAAGTVVTVSTPDQRGDVRLLMKQAAISATTTTVRPGDPAILALTGPAAAYVAPSPVVQPAPNAPRRARPGSGAGSSAGQPAGGPRRRAGSVPGAAGASRGAGRSGSRSRAAASGRGSGASSQAVPGSVAQRHSAAAFSAGRSTGRPGR